jgi:hypothetical protein
MHKCPAPVYQDHLIFFFSRRGCIRFFTKHRIICVRGLSLQQGLKCRATAKFMAGDISRGLETTKVAIEVYRIRVSSFCGKNTRTVGCTRARV